MRPLEVSYSTVTILAWASTFVTSAVSHLFNDTDRTSHVSPTIKVDFVPTIRGDSGFILTNAA